jgi:predicted MPP superfamily phosphohydrolase
MAIGSSHRSQAMGLMQYAFAGGARSRADNRVVNMHRPVGPESFTLDTQDESIVLRASAAPVDSEPSSGERKALRSPWLMLGQPHAFEWNRVTLLVPALPAPLEGLRILHVTDFHLRARWYDSLDRLLSRIQEDPPDLLLATGDFSEDRYNYRPALPYVLRLIDGFRARLGCFGITGNHDELGLSDHFEGTNLTFVENRRLEIPVDDATIELIGLPGHNRELLDPAWVASLPRQKRNSVRIVLSHHPDNIRRTQNLAPDLFLAGHTHGGQVCLPGGIPILRHDKLPRRYARGIHRYGDSWLVVNRGFGFSGFPLRTFCPPEVIELTLMRGEPTSPSVLPNV